MSTDVKEQYEREHIFEDIITALEKAGIPKSTITRKQLAAADEFHIRGFEVTAELAKQVPFEKGMKVLDVGCGIGGPSRFFADEYGCLVTGIDLTPEFVRTAKLLSELVGLQDRTNFIEGNALALPLPDASFDRVITQHVQMNIAEKEKFYQEISRVLKPGGIFIYYDIFSMAHQPISFPLPWADTEDLNHLITTDELKTLLANASLELTTTTDQTKSSIDFFQKLMEHSSKHGLPSFGLVMVVGNSLMQKLKNLYQNVIEGRLVLQSGICKKS